MELVQGYVEEWEPAQGHMEDREPVYGGQEASAGVIECKVA